MRRIALLLLVQWGCVSLSRSATLHTAVVEFPIQPDIVVDGQFRGAEGIAFSGEGRLFVTADRRLWEVLPTGTTRRIADLGSTVGLAPIGARDVLVAEFGPLVRLSSGPNSDGAVLRVTPEGEIDTVASGLGDPNFILVRRGNTLLVSDDFTDEIWEVTLDGQRSIFTRAINYPNGMAEAADGTALYVAQIFRRIDPIEQDDRLWRIPLSGRRPSGAPEVVFRTGGAGGLDGLAMDEQGRVYVAANREGRLWRFDPRDGSALLIAENVAGIASLAFGGGAFDEHSLYATQLRGGQIWRFKVGARGMPLVR